MVVKTPATVVFMPYCVQVSVLVGRKTLFLYNLHDPDNPVELAFQQRYGSVVTYKWYVYCVQTSSECIVFRRCLVTASIVVS